MELHHGKRHAAYVKGANDTPEKLAAARDAGDFGAIVGPEKTLAFNLAGHAIHTVFWRNLTPPSSAAGNPDGELAAAVDEFFGSADNLRAHMTAVSTTIHRSGWGGAPGSRSVSG